MPRGYAGTPSSTRTRRWHTQQKIRLMLKIGSDHCPVYEDLLKIILKTAEKQPGAVLDAMIDVLGDES